MHLLVAVQFPQILEGFLQITPAQPPVICLAHLQLRHKQTSARLALQRALSAHRSISAATPDAVLHTRSGSSGRPTSHVGSVYSQDVALTRRLRSWRACFSTCFDRSDLAFNASLIRLTTVWKPGSRRMCTKSTFSAFSCSHWNPE